MGTIDRIRYYDGEFLRASDFSDEQTYHMEMRRRLNRYLHLYGIVHGLELSSDGSSSGVTQISILPGLAIDAFGREIYVFSPYTLGDADIQANPVKMAGDYHVWLRYQKTASEPPASGYSACNQTNQYTRWIESFSVVLLQSPAKPFSDPGFSDDDTDDPTQDSVGVLLGIVHIDPTSALSTFSNPQPDAARLKLWGVVAQRIRTPYDARQASPAFSFLNANTPGTPNTPLAPLSSLEIIPNIFADQNVMVGPDFPLTAASSAPAISFTPSPTGASAGNAKIAGDLFVQGNVYTLLTSGKPPSPPAPTPGTQQWIGIGPAAVQALQSSIPDFIASQPFNVPVPATAPSAASFVVNPAAYPFASTKVLTIGSVVAAATISGIVFNTNVAFGSSNPVGVFITSVTGTPGTAGTGQFTVAISYTVSGNFNAGDQTPILSFYVTVTAFCIPA